jgi:hypothetical protein
MEDIEVISEDGLVKVEMEYIGEGIDGDYDDKDPDDMPLMRFSIYRKITDDAECREKMWNLTLSDFCEEEIGEWVYVEDSSYCTQIWADLPTKNILEAAKFILSCVEDNVRDMKREKRLYESLSWIRFDQESGEVKCEYGCFQ